MSTNDLASCIPDGSKIETVWKVDEKHNPGLILSYKRSGKSIIQYKDGDE